MNEQVMLKLSEEGLAAINEKLVAGFTVNHNINVGSDVFVVLSRYTPERGLSRLEQVDCVPTPNFEYRSGR